MPKPWDAFPATAGRVTVRAGGFARAIAIVGTLPLLLLGSPAQAADEQMYRCQDDDSVTFSQTPCGSDAQPVDIEYTEPTAAEASQASARAQETAAAADAAAADDERRQRIAATEREISELKQARDRTLGELAAERQRGTEDRADDTYRVEKRVEMQAVVDDYDTRIEELEGELSRLRAE